MVVKVSMKGLDKHELVLIDILDVPKTIRKIYGMALDKKQENFFKILGFKKEADCGKDSIYSFYPNGNKN